LPFVLLIAKVCFPLLTRWLRAKRRDVTLDLPPFVSQFYSLILFVTKQLTQSLYLVVQAVARTIGRHTTSKHGGQTNGHTRSHHNETEDFVKPSLGPPAASGLSH
jgi:hypothetical protein